MRLIMVYPVNIGGTERGEGGEEKGERRGG